MGAAGLTSSTSEMADKGGVGIELDLDHVPQREAGMTAYEMMLSESQERMLMILKPGREAEAEAIFRKWGLDFAVIGQTTDTGRMIVTPQGRRSKPTCRSTSSPTPRRSTSGRGSPTVPPKVDPARVGAGAQRHPRHAQDHDGRPAPVLAPLDLGAVRPHGDGRHRAAPRRRRGRRARARHQQGHRRSPATSRPATSLADPGDGHQAGGGRDLAQPDRRRRRSARHHRQHELRQPRAARDHGPVRRRRRRA